MLLLLAPFGVAGCGGVAPYATIGAGYQVDDNTDWYHRTDRDWQCSKQPQFHGELGLEFEHQITLFYHHQSWWRCGGPFNHDPETYVDYIGLEKKFGGK